MDEKKLVKFFVKTFKDVVLPVLEDMHKDIKELKQTTERTETKLDKHEDHLERHDSKLDNHEKRLTQLETTPHN
ncbi:MAG: hypothetical protein A2700_01205 [Candidatus Blackburnbacteria bacterium RIFCSPHIGHO2_01_FULL_44_64]|uniref:Uncharacterized protein n=1 Tax=Candidatus Blackburnbacteria bacterium RIFCSPHIGHO2_02_FULL_44_20 TaxID=1797516 RepID=A0A1G1V4L3_9BACT|nr:MAG: hypothetical protein A2700_01205 [Candidatus Blackburnbacteria bacterium RIFCSPHIGHO2_01_FULL_44_64]OGY10282.1 MAG: hypothetical protein A3D26_04845 [Candidatus Blackburnbacteria bacterium RIFCSPHIGHO2_02_FULL_44_20]